MSITENNTPLNGNQANAPLNGNHENAPEYLNNVPVPTETPPFVESLDNDYAPPPQPPADDAPTLNGKAERMAIPSELKQFPNFVLWRYEEVKGKLTKVPYQRNGDNAATNNHETWCSFDDALKVWKANPKRYDGIGFMFSPEAGITGIDIDDCVNDDGTLTAEAEAIVKQFNSYTEYSPSGKGLHIFIYGAKTGTSCKTTKQQGMKCVEIYDRKRYFTLTGNHLQSTPKTIEKRQQQLEDLEKRLWPAPKQPAQQLNGNHNLSDDEIIELCRKNNPKFDALWRGDVSAYGDDDSSADMALCNILALYTKSSSQIDRIFRQSRLYRDKWERKDYRERTIEKALSSVTETYSAKPEAKKRGRPRKENRIERLENHLTERYEFRRNLVKSRIECRKRGEKAWEPMTDYKLNKFKLDAAKQDLPANWVLPLIESEDVQSVDVLAETVKGAKWSGRDTIGEMFSTLKLSEETDPQLAEKYFRRWLIAMVAGWVSPRTVNQTCLILHGKQGCGKTTFGENLLPESLYEYTSTGAIDPKNKDSKIRMAEYGLINLDELESMTRGELGHFKSLITLTKINERRPYAHFDAEMIRRASFFGSINQKDFLSDFTGNRRFLVVSVDTIDRDKMAEVDRLDMLAQAYALYKDGEKYWFDGAEIDEINAENEKHKVERVEKVLLEKYFEPCEKDDTEGEFITATEIGLKFCDWEKGYKFSNYSATEIGRGAVELGWKTSQKSVKTNTKRTSAKGYYLKRLFKTDQLQTPQPF